MQRRTLRSAAIAIGLTLPLAFLAPVTAAVAAPAGVHAAVVRASIEPIPDGVTRLSGASRYETAVAVSQRHAPGVAVAYVASGADFPDALAAASAAALDQGPLLLTNPGYLPDVVVDELDRLKPARIKLIGGLGAVGPRRAVHAERHRADDPPRGRRPLHDRPRDRQVGVRLGRATRSSRRGAPSLTRSPPPRQPGRARRRSCSSTARCRP